MTGRPTPRCSGQRCTHTPLDDARELVLSRDRETALNQVKRMELIEQINGLGGIDWDQPLPVVSLEDFFAGNDDLGSIGCNLNEHPGLARFYSTLKSVRDRFEVQDVLVQISEVDPDDSSMWPFSERIYILTAAHPEQVAPWLATLQPSEVTSGWSNGRPSSVPDEHPDHAVVAAWWD